MACEKGEGRKQGQAGERLREGKMRSERLTLSPHSYTTEEKDGKRRFLVLGSWFGWPWPTGAGSTN